MNHEKRYAIKLHWQNFTAKLHGWNQFRGGPANLGLMTGFVRDGGGPIAARIATP